MKTSNIIIIIIIIIIMNNNHNNNNNRLDTTPKRRGSIDVFLYRQKIEKSTNHLGVASHFRTFYSSFWLPWHLLKVRDKKSTRKEESGWATCSHLPTPRKTNMEPQTLCFWFRSAFQEVENGRMWPTIRVKIIEYHLAATKSWSPTSVWWIQFDPGYISI